MPVDETSALEVDAKRVLSHLRHAFGEIIQSLPGKISRPHEIQKTLQIDKRLAWKISKFVHDDDLFGSVRHLAGPSGIDIFLSAAARKKVPTELIHSTKTAVSEFDKLIKTHAGGRADLEMMLGGYAKNSRADTDLTHRKAAFSANSYIWGVQAQTQLSVYLLSPNADGRRIDVAVVRGFMGLRRIRSVPWVISRVRCLDDDGKVRHPPVLEPLDPRCAEPGGEPAVPLLRDFCSQPLPPTRRVPDCGGYLADELLETEVGNLGEITCLTGEVAYQGSTRYQDEHNDLLTFTTLIRTPVEELIFDCFVHQDLYPKFEPSLHVYGDLSLSTTDVRTERDRLPSTDAIQQLGTDPTAAYTPNIPNYSRIIRWVCERLGWTQESFQLHRVRMSYPVNPSSVRMSTTLPKAP